MKIRFKIMGFCSLLLIGAAPAFAEGPTADAQNAAAMEEMDKIFGEIEPLTADQQKRLPLARAVMVQFMPEGAMSKMVKPIFDKILAPMLNKIEQRSAEDVARLLRVNEDTLDLSDDDIKEITALLDPARDKRTQLFKTQFPIFMDKMMVKFEPIVRDAMIELYAINFNDAQLTDIGAFLATPTGQEFGQKMYTMGADPRMIRASVKMVPSIMQDLMPLANDLQKQAESLGKARKFNELDSASRARIAELTGISEAKLRKAAND